MPGGPQEDRYAAGQEGLREALAGLAVARQDEAEYAGCHGLQHWPVRLHLQLVQVKVALRACHLSSTQSHSRRFLVRCIAVKKL